MKQLLGMLQKEDTDAEIRGELFLQTLYYIRKVETYQSYSSIISVLLPSANKNMETFAVTGNFLPEELEEYIRLCEIFYCEFVKYQIWLVGNAEDCAVAEKILDLSKVHILGMVSKVHPAISDCDYIFVCTTFQNFIEEYTVERILGGARIVWFDFIRWGMQASPESFYVQTTLGEEKMKQAVGIVTGMSYTQRGICYDKLEKSFLCMARPSQDFYIDYHQMLWAYDEIAKRSESSLQYCIIEMNYYRLWYDASHSANSYIMYHQLLNLGILHHLDIPSAWLRELETDKQICRELIGDDYQNTIYQALGYDLSEALWLRGEQKYIPDQEQYAKDIPQVQKLFDKDYPKTLQENVGLLHRYMKFLMHHQIRCLIYLPPFPRIFFDYAPEHMKQTTYEVIGELQEKYGVDCLDLTECDAFREEHFADCHHLNNAGAELATEYINQYIRENWQE